MRTLPSCLLLFLCLVSDPQTGRTSDPDETAASAEDNQRLAARRNELYQRARQLWLTGKRDEGLQLSAQILEIDRKYFADAPDRVTSTIAWLAGLSEQIEDWPGALKLREEALERRIDVYGDDHWRVTDARLALENTATLRDLTDQQRRDLSEARKLRSDALKLHTGGDSATAIRKQRQSSETLLRILGSDHPLSIHSLHVLGNVCATSDPELAESLFQRAMQQRKELYGEVHPIYADAISGLAWFYCGQKKYEQAAPLLEKSLQVQTAAYGKPHSRMLYNIRTLAGIHVERKQADKAELYYRRAVQIRETQKPEDVADHSTLLRLLVRSMLEQQKYQAAEEYALKSVSITEQAFGKRHEILADALDDLGKVRLGTGDLVKARALFERAVQIDRENGAVRTVQFVAMLDRLAKVCQVSGDFEKAGKLYEENISRARDTYGARHAVTGGTMVNAALHFLQTGELDQAESLARKAVALLEPDEGEPSKEYIASVGTLANVYLMKKDVRQARFLFEKTIQLKRDANDTENVSFAASLSNLSLLLRRTGDFVTAQPLADEAHGVLTRTLSESDPEFAMRATDLARAHHGLCDYAKAAALAIKAVESTRRLGGRQHPQYVKRLLLLASIYVDQGDIVRAKPLYEQALELTRDSQRDRRRDHIACLTALAKIAFETDDRAEASRLTGLSLELIREQTGKDSAREARQLNHLAVLRYMARDYAAALPLLEQADRLQTKQTAADDRRPLYIRRNLADVYRRLEKFDEAEKLVRSFIAARQPGQPEDRSYCSDLMALSVLHYQTGRIEESRGQMKQTLEVANRVYGPDHPSIAYVHHFASVLNRAAKDFENARYHAEEALNITRRFLDDSSAILSERQQLSMALALRHRLDGYLSLVLDQEGDRQDAVAEIVAWKGATLVRQRAMRMVADDPQLAGQFQQLQRVVRQLASLARTRPAEKDRQEAWQKSISELIAVRKRLESDLSRDSSEFRASQTSVSLSDIQKAIPENAVFVDFLQYRYRKQADPSPDGDPHLSLLASVIQSQGHPVLVPLGSVEDAAERIEAWRESFGGTTESQQAGKQLRQQLWEPLLEHIGDAQTILISGDGVLGRLPFSALPGRESGTFLLEDHRLAMIPVPQLLPGLTTSNGRRELSRELLLLGDVDYSSDPGKPAADKKRRPRHTPRAARDGVEFDPLPGTREEVVVIADLYRELFETDDDDLALLRKTGATEARFRELAPQFFHLHLATHGFFADQNVGRAEVDVSAFATSERAGLTPSYSAIGSDNPGLFSGLVFAGANRKPQPGQDDGILTSQEIAFLPLGAVDTVVLSACETGLGRISSGEGLIGVQRAFQVAGARSVIASLWKVDDVVTRRLMERFYRNLFEREMSRLDALREAQLWLLRNPEQVRGARRSVKGKDQKRVSPYYWAGFVLSGDWR